MILSVGEALFDMIERPAGRSIKSVVGGSTLNVALGLQRLGRKAGYLTRLSTDHFGDRLMQFLNDEGIDTSLVTRAEGMQTTLAFAFRKRGGSADYSFYAANAADRSMLPTDLPTLLAADITAVHFGSISLVLEPTASTLAGFLTAIADDRLISLDPNIRASLIDDRLGWRRRFDTFLARADFIKASIEDVQWIYGDAATAAQTARDWSMAGPKIAVVTDGKSGATVAVAGETRFVPSDKIKVVDTVGAGDTFQAAYLARLDELGLLSKSAIAGIDLASAEEIARFAVAAAAITCTRVGADLPTRADVEAFLSARLEDRSSR